MIKLRMTENQPIIFAIVVAAGRGERAGGDLPKQYRQLGTKTMLRRSIESFHYHPSVSETIAVIHPDHEALFAEATASLSIADPVHGGDARQDSVRLGLEAVAARGGADYVLIHDAARPFVPGAVVDRVLDALFQGAKAALPVLPVVDTLKRSDDGTRVDETVARAGLWRAQTPQGFDFGQILGLHRDWDGTAATDDAALAEEAGVDVITVVGDERAFKVTTPEDFARAHRYLATGYETRVGSGFDVHRFADGDSLMLCGIEIMHEHGLEGHSDADVGLHALTDALLGAIGDGDIGSHFPPSELRWRGAPSAIFLQHAASLLRNRGGEISNLDVTVICQAPKIGPHRDAMRARIAEILSIERDRVSVKATTTERLGFTGRGEGIAAQASVLVRLPNEMGDE